MKDIYLTGVISSWSWCSNLEWLQYQISETIPGEQCTIYINSPGGDFVEGMAIYNYLLGLNPRPIVKIIGMAGSIASVIALAGEKVMMAETAMMLIHNPYIIDIDYNNTDDLRKIADDIDKFKIPMINAYCKKTGLSEEEVKSLMDAETYLTAQEAKDKGFVDIIYSPDIAEARGQFKVAALARPNKTEVKIEQNKITNQIFEKTNGEKQMTLEEKFAKLEAEHKEQLIAQAELISKFESKANDVQALQARTEALEKENEQLRDNLMLSEIDGAVEKLIAEAKLPRALKEETVTKLYAFKSTGLMFAKDTTMYDFELGKLQSVSPSVTKSPLAETLNVNFNADSDDLKAQSDSIKEFNKKRGLV